MMRSPLSSALATFRRSAWSVVLFSAAVNILMLAGPLYMLQVYDRVLGSRSVPTLVALTICLVGAFAFQALFDALRGRVMIRAARLFDRALGSSVHAAVLRIASQSRDAGLANQPVRDVDQVRGFLTSAGPVALVDLPWVPLFLAACFIIHPWLGCLAVGGGLVLAALAWMTERGSNVPSAEASRQAGRRSAMAEADRSNAETIVAMGMGNTMAGRWSQANESYLEATSAATDVTGTYGSLSKVLRILLQSAILGLGAYLVIRQEMTSGAMIAASIMVGRALAPVEIAIAHWRGFVQARQSLQRLRKLLIATDPARGATELPPPVKRLEVQNVAVRPAPNAPPTVAGINFRLDAGEALGIVGPSGSGKTSLVRALTGVWPLAAGHVRLDGASIDQWTPDTLGPHIGYLAQAVDLFDGTIAENIARMSMQPDSEAVVAAARAAGAHDMIVRLPGGYDARIGVSGGALSAGQRQRIALARALYGKPFLIVLDEPNANLDAEGEIALQKAVMEEKARGAIVILIAHRPSTLVVCDKMLAIMGGTQQAFGPRDEVMAKITAPPRMAPAANVVPVRSEAMMGGSR